MSVVSEEALTDLPAPVQRCLRRSGVVGHPVPERVRLRQRGEILLRGRWLPLYGDEHYTLDPVGFTWRGTVRLAGVPLARAEDSFADGRGRMHVQLLGLVTVVDATGPGMDQGSLMRWLNETMWFPHVWATDTIRWQGIDGRSASGSVSVGDLTVEAEFRFDDEGRVVDFVGDRYRVEDGEAELTPWSTPIDDHAVFDGVEVASHGRAIWDPDGEAFEYIRLRITALHVS